MVPSGDITDETTEIAMTAPVDDATPVVETAPATDVTPDVDLAAVVDLAPAETAPAAETASVEAAPVSGPYDADQDAAG